MQGIRTLPLSPQIKVFSGHLYYVLHQSSYSLPATQQFHVGERCVAQESFVCNCFGSLQKNNDYWVVRVAIFATGDVSRHSCQWCPNKPQQTNHACVLRYVSQTQTGVGAKTGGFEAAMSKKRQRKTNLPLLKAVDRCYHEHRVSCYNGPMGEIALPPNRLITERLEFPHSRNRATKGEKQVDVPAWQRLHDLRQDTHNDKLSASRRSTGIGMWQWWASHRVCGAKRASIRNNRNVQIKLRGNVEKPLPQNV